MCNNFVFSNGGVDCIVFGFGEFIEIKVCYFEVCIGRMFIFFVRILFICSRYKNMVLSWCMLNVFIENV